MTDPAEPRVSKGATPFSMYSIGYGNRSLSVFIEELRSHGIEYLVDVRSSPNSAFKPEFSREALSSILGKSGIRYVFMGDTLGGRPDDMSCYSDGKVDYDKVRTKPFFEQGIARLMSALNQNLSLALMCSEGRPSECHRTKLIGVSLQNAGVEILHIDEAGVIKTQDEVILEITNGQLSLLDPPTSVTKSRKRYASNRQHRS